MDKILYDLMDWAGIEELVYSEAANPHGMLGAHMTEAGMLVQVFIPTARDITVKLAASGRQFQMELVDEAGFFAVLIPRKTLADYTLLVFYDNGTLGEMHDPYSFAPQLTDADLKRFEAGIHYTVYNKMGAHPITVKGVEGVSFAVWAPCAMRVSVVGDFNLWDGRRHQMRRLGDSGVFEIFIPGLKTGVIYKYEIKFKNGDPALKADPYANYAELRPHTASVVWDLNGYKWKDQEWTKRRAQINSKEQPMSIYEVHLGSFMRKELQFDDLGNELIGTEFYNYREIAEKLAEYVLYMGYTHVELMPVMEHPLDASWGYQVTGYYAPTSRYGTPDDFMYFMDYMHTQGIGVILDWVPAHFPRDSWGMAQFDGTCVYEHKDPRKGSHPHWGTLIYNYGRPGVSNFLIANAMFWADKYHADGIRFDAVASMIYLDYGKNPGEWVANMYGGHENLEAVEFLRHLNSVFKERRDGVFLIAEESTAWPKVTGPVKEDGLGFDYKWNMGWMNDFLGYMRYDPYFRCHHYRELTFSLLYAYSEDFILVFSHDEVVHGKGSLAGKMPGKDLEEKLSNLRAAYGFMLGHPGKKLLFMGQDFAQVSEWSESAELEWGLLEDPAHSRMQDFVRELNRLYRLYPALCRRDYHPDGFEWINCMDADNNIVVFLRKTDKPEETLLFLCNFAPVLHKKYSIGVPFEGRYKEILNSSAVKYGGDGEGNPRVKISKNIEENGREYSITVTVPPLGVCIFTCTPEEGKAPGKAKAPAKAQGRAKALEKQPEAAKKPDEVRQPDGVRRPDETAQPDGTKQLDEAKRLGETKQLDETTQSEASPRKQTKASNISFIADFKADREIKKSGRSKEQKKTAGARLAEIKELAAQKISGRKKEVKDEIRRKGPKQSE